MKIQFINALCSRNIKVAEIKFIMEFMKEMWNHDLE